MTELQKNYNNSAISNTSTKILNKIITSSDTDTTTFLNSIKSLINTFYKYYCFSNIVLKTP